jgi:alkanesulfonate monooxygenase SsuD/methylene tetrahydromethanopterin reductase-like flavin-dependent oxidoreductase (luciferase family)
MAVLAEEVGFDSLWVGDHLLYADPPRGPWEAWTILAALAAVTDRVELGPLVASTSFHNPALLAKKATTIDEISGGRLILGLGAGWNETEYQAFGFRYDHRVSRFEEAFTIIRSLVRTGYADFAGSFYDVSGCRILPRGPRPEGPPIMIGSRGRRMLSITAPHMDMWNAWYGWYGNRRDRLSTVLAELDAALEAVGRNPAEVVRTTAVLVALPGASGRRPGVPGRSTGDPLKGSPQELAEELAAYVELGIGHLQLVLDPITDASIEHVGEVLELLDRP